MSKTYLNYKIEKSIYKRGKNPQTQQCLLDKVIETVVEYKEINKLFQHILLAFKHDENLSDI